MHTIEELEKRVSKAIDEIVLPQTPSELYDPVHYTLALGGKRLRPLLVLAACDLFGGNIEDAVGAATGIELFHNFTLLHDDLMDHAPLRRGKETVYRKWNPNIAILAGDTMLAIANQYILQTRHHVAEVARVFNQTAVEVCEGQQYDMNFETTAGVSLDDYMMMIRLKTAVLLAASLKIGAVIANASSQQADTIYRFGLNLGLAFQLQDDLLDVYSNENSFGKVHGGDIVAGKKTFLYFAALQQLGSQQEGFAGLYSGDAIAAPDKIKAVKTVFDNLNIRAITMAEIEKLVSSALVELSSLQLPEIKSSLLASLATRLTKREN